ncbi:MAG: HDOD domain-containing protein [Kofleriaceae bacterium]
MTARPPDPAPADDVVAATRSLDTLPTLPLVAVAAAEVLQSPRATITQIAEILRGDPTLSAKLLRLVNSAYFGIPGGVSDVSRAIPFIGFSTLHQLVLSVSVFETLELERASGFDPRALWLHAITVGTCARVLAEDLGMTNAGTCFTAGLLHDVGKIALAKLAPEQLARAYACARADGVSMDEAERRVGLPSHDVVGARLARQWRFPPELAAPIEQHHHVHQPGFRARVSPPLRALTEVVAAADLVAHRCALSTDASLLDPPLDRAAGDLFERVGFSAARQRELHAKTMRQLEVSKVFLTLVDGG